jgi:hypothetical protein
VGARIVRTVLDTWGVIPPAARSGNDRTLATPVRNAGFCAAE